VRAVAGVHLPAIRARSHRANVLASGRDAVGSRVRRVTSGSAGFRRSSAGIEVAIPKQVEEMRPMSA